VSEQPAVSLIVAFGHFEADLRTEELRKRGLPVRLSAQSFQVLRLLLLRPGELVSRQELQKALWPNDSFGDFEHGLNATVNRLRDALGDSAENPRFIETLPRRGYRFIASIEPREETSARPMTLQQALTPEVASSPQDPTAPKSHRAATSSAALTPVPPLTGSALRRWLVVGSGICLLLLVGVGLFPKLKRDLAPSFAGDTVSALEAVPLTSLVGNEWEPTLSPDGSQVAFTWDQGRTDGSANLFLKIVGAERVQQLTHGLDGYLQPAWSPDGRTVAFAHVPNSNKGESGIFTIPALGGPLRKIADGHLGSGTYPSIGWSPDSRNIFFSDLDGVESVAVDSGDVRSVYAKPNCQDPPMAVSPDGRWIAVDCWYEGMNALKIISSASGTEKDLINFMDFAAQLAWSPDSQRVIYIYQGKLAEIRREGGVPHILEFTHDVIGPSVSRRGNRLAYTQYVSSVNLWRLSVAGAQSGSATREIGSSSQEREPDVSPDGRHLAFISTRSGFEQVWSSTLDGSDAVQLTHAHSLTGGPRWSPDGKTIAFDSRDCGRPCLYLLDPERGIPRELLTGDLEASMPNWSRDGRWIYFTGVAAGVTELYKVSSAGGPIQLVSHSAGYNAQQTADGSRLYFLANPHAYTIDGEIHVLHRDTGVEEPLQGMPRVHFPIEWVLGSKGIYFLDPTQSPAIINFYSFATSRVEKHWPLQKPPPYWGGMALSRDETWIVYPQNEQGESDLMLVENFR
jgi:Tol biopolymer transport system component/DNA-binding winged helix-turn-helix (wHTH) protein